MHTSGAGRACKCVEAHIAAMLASRAAVWWRLQLLAAVAAGVVATGLGECPVYPPLPNFDISRMLGTWYEVERSFYLMELPASCTQLNVTLADRGNFYIRVRTVNKWTGMPSVTSAVGIPSHNGSSIFRYKVNNRMPYLIGRLLPGAGLYNVLFTDYEQYAIVWSCTSVNIAHTDRMWVLGRSRELPAAVRARAYELLRRLRLNPDRLLLSNNYHCDAPVPATAPPPATPTTAPVDTTTATPDAPT